MMVEGFSWKDKRIELIKNVDCACYRCKKIFEERFEELDKEAVKRLKEDDVEMLAEFLHNTYEALSKINDWKTQKKCRVKFKDLPEENKKVMLQLSAHIITRNNVRIFEIFGDKS